MTLVVKFCWAKARIRLRINAMKRAEPTPLSQTSAMTTPMRRPWVMRKAS